MSYIYVVSRLRVKGLTLACFARSDFPASASVSPQVPVTWQNYMTMHQKAMINLKRHFCINYGTEQDINYHIFISFTNMILKKHKNLFC
jgi:hypothetical protein